MPYDRRDLIGHWIRKQQPEQRLCGHACCRGYRVHPANMPVILPNRLLRRASDDDLAQHFHEVSGQRTADETAAWYQILAEMERRDDLTAKRAAARERYQATVLGRRFERAEAVEHAYVQAERATNGYMLNKAGGANGIDERSLFTGPESRARRYASEELIEHWRTHPRPKCSRAGSRAHPLRVLARVPAGGWPPCWRLFCPALIFSWASCSRISPRRGLFAVAGSTSPRV
jgi:hypothetical protein